MQLPNKKSLATRGAAVLVACALGAATVAHAAEPKSRKTEEKQIKALQDRLHHDCEDDPRPARSQRAKAASS